MVINWETKRRKHFHLNTRKRARAKENAGSLVMQKVLSSHMDCDCHEECLERLPNRSALENTEDDVYVK